MTATPPLFVSMALASQERRMPNSIRPAHTYKINIPEQCDTGAEAVNQ